MRFPLKALAFFALAFNGLMLFWLGEALIGMLKPSDAAAEETVGKVVPTVLLDSDGEATKGESSQEGAPLTN